MRPAAPEPRVLHDCVCRAGARYGLGFFAVLARLQAVPALAAAIEKYRAGLRVLATTRLSLCTGTSGYSYGWWRAWYGVPRKQWLDKYARTFGCLELNVTFYRRLGAPFYARLRAVADRTGLGYVVKLNRYATHAKLLNSPESWWPSMYREYSQLGSALKCILVQLPPKFKRFSSRGDRLVLLKRLAAVVPADAKLAFEFRSRDWYADAVYDLLQANNWCLCILHVQNAAGWAGDLPSGWTPRVFTAGYTYYRLHGAAGQYVGPYAYSTLVSEVVQPLRRAARRENYVFFNNTDGGAPLEPGGPEVAAAIRDALLLEVAAGQNTPLSGVVRGRAPPKPRLKTLLGETHSHVARR